MKTDMINQALNTNPRSFLRVNTFLLALNYLNSHPGEVTLKDLFNGFNYMPGSLYHEVFKTLPLYLCGNCRYLQEYILQLCRAHIWQDIIPIVRVGDLVLELDPNQPHGLWKKADIVTLLRSRDGLVRQVQISRNGKWYTRALAQLSPLDVNLQDNE
jgi:hypothetical protein